MADREPEPNNPLGPYYPAEVPDIPGNARTWLAVLVAGLFLLGMVAQVIRLLGG